jgi:hypothetical protein
VLRINLDETSVCLFQGDQKGNVFFVDKRRGAEGQPVQRVSRSKRRCCLTHIGLICDRPDVQAVLPQVIVGNEATFKAGGLAMLKSACPGNVRLVRQKSAWNNELLMAMVVRMLALALRPYLGEFQPLLLLDAVRLHTARAALAACATCRIWPVIVPAKTTWLLQPLDTHAFQQYKVYLRRAYQEARIKAGRSDLETSEFLACLYETIRHVLQGRRWADAFNLDGFGNNQAGLSSYVKRQLGVESVTPLPASCPTLDQLKLCFPRRSIIPVAALWKPFAPTPIPKAMVSASPARPEAIGLASGPVLRMGRTRAEHRLVQCREAQAVKAASPAVAAEPGNIRVATALRLPRARAKPPPVAPGS